MIATGGGTFDPDSQRPIYFAAGNLPTEEDVWPPYTLIAVNDIMKSDDELARRIQSGVTFLDSGIFALTNEHMRAHPGLTMDDALTLPPDQIDGFDALFDRYVELVKRWEHELWGYVELDQGGRDNKIKTRARLESLGLRPIPVYHPLNDGWDYFHELASNYDRICVGNIVQASPSLRTKIIATIWERHRDYPHLWIHGLGYTASPMMHAYPLDSCDSSTWLAPLRWGMVARQVTTNLEAIADHQGESRYVSGIRRTRDKACALASWTVHSATMQWRAAQAELAELGLEPLPARLDMEVPPSPSR